MSLIQIAGIDGGKVAVDHTKLESLKASLRGELLKPGDSAYDQARTLWNEMINHRPALIVSCAGVADVQTTVRFARENGLLTAIRAAGHNIAGKAVCDGGLLIDLSRMKSVRVDPQATRVHVEPGVTLGELDHETQAFGLATPVGINSTTGVSGLTLGGGFGWLTRKHGMTVDSLTAADVVTADGELLQTSPKKHSDLFWATQGGGGNFGVVTRYEFKLYPVGPEVYSGLVVYPLAEAISALKKYREYVSTIGDETCVWALLRKAPPLPFLPKSAHGQEVLVFACCHAGDPTEGKKAIEPVRGFGNIIGEHLGLNPFCAWQKAFDPLLTPGARNYWKSHNFVELADEALEIAVRYAAKLPSDECEIFFASLGGQAARKAPEATAYPHRDANFVLNVHGRWQDAADDDKCISWAREFYQASTPFATGGVYVNFLAEDETDRVQAAYGSNFDRLLRTKKVYDPENFFRVNQNISNGDGSHN